MTAIVKHTCASTIGRKSTGMCCYRKEKSLLLARIPQAQDRWQFSWRLRTVCAKGTCRWNSTYEVQTTSMLILILILAWHVPSTIRHSSQSQYCLSIICQLRSFQASSIQILRKTIKREKLENGNSTGNAEPKHAINVVLSNAFWSTSRR